MTVLFAVVGTLALIAVVAAAWHRARRDSRTTLRHHMALDTLAQITTDQSAPGSVRTSHETDPHVRVVGVPPVPLVDDGADGDVGESPGNTINEASPARPAAAVFSTAESGYGGPVVPAEQVVSFRLSPPRRLSGAPASLPPEPGSPPMRYGVRVLRAPADATTSAVAAHDGDRFFPAALRFDDSGLSDLEPAGHEEGPSDSPELVPAAAEPIAAEPIGAEPTQAATTATAQGNRPLSQQTAARVAGVAAAVIGVGAIATTLIHRGPSHHTVRTARSPVIARPTVTHSPPPTSPPPQVTIPVQLIASSQSTSVYKLNGAAVITLRSTGSCWVAVHKGDANGPSLFTATMTAGQSETVSSPAWVRLGNPTMVTVQVNGMNVPAAPIISGNPYDLQFQ